jgi:hypothetical protein
VMERTKSLLSGGFGLEEIDTLRKMIGDVGVVMGPEKAAAFAEQIADIGRNGMMTSRQLMMLRHILPMDAVRKELGISADGMNKMLDGTSNKAIEVGRGLSAIGRAIRDTWSRGILGDITKQDAQTLPKLIERVKMIPETFMSALAGFDQGVGGGLFSGALENIIKAFAPGSETADRMVSHVRLLVDRVAEAFGLGGAPGGFLAELAGPGGVAKVEDIFNRITKGVEDAIPVLAAAGKLAWSVVSAMSWLYEKTHSRDRAEVGLEAAEAKLAAQERW